jgi:hypothetical protein
MRHTVSVDGADDVEVEVEAEVEDEADGLVLEPVVLVEELELQPAMASAAVAAHAAVPSTADLFLSPTAGTPSARV